jgi:hypothetical protein
VGRRFGVRLRLEQAQAAALRLGLIERDVGAFEKRLLIIPMARAKRAADAESEANARPSSMKCASKQDAIRAAASRAVSGEPISMAMTANSRKKRGGGGVPRFGHKFPRIFNEA